MVEVLLPYGGAQLAIDIPREHFLGEIKPCERPGVPDPVNEVCRALESPIRSKKLCEIAKPGDSAAIVIDDQTRPAPSCIMVPPILEELKNAGVDLSNVSVIVGCGTHRKPTEDEIRRLLGDIVLSRVEVAIHDCDSPDLVFVGETRFGTKVWLNRQFAEADVKILTGDIELHYFAGYGGGRKSVLPGVAGRRSINQNHSLLFHPKATTGNLRENPVHEDMTEAAELAGVDFSLNVVLNSRREVVRAFAGDFRAVLAEGAKLVDEMCKVEVKREADIIIASAGGHPFDLDLFQSTKAIHNAIRAVRRGGVVILVAECGRGHGSETFLNWMKRYKVLSDAENALKQEFVIGGHVAHHLLKNLSRARILLVSKISSKLAKIFRLELFEDLEGALKRAYALAPGKKVYAMPLASRTLPVLR